MNQHQIILMVGMNDELRQTYISGLEGRYQFKVENNLEEVLGFFEKYKSFIALIILDENLGCEKVETLLEKYFFQNCYRSIPMCLLLNEDDSKVKDMGIMYGATEILVKPVDVTVLQRRTFYLTDVFGSRFIVQKTMDIQKKELEESLDLLGNMRLSFLESLGTIVEFRHFDYGKHVSRVRLLTDILMKEIQASYPEYHITDKMIEEVNYAATMHDIGKISVSDSILNKPGKLTEEEFEEIKKHTLYGKDIIEEFKGLYTDESYRFYRDIILYHHEKWDGRGYPYGLKGDDIPIWSQVVSLVDVYDALTNERVYKKAYSHKTAMKMILEGECGLYNPKVLESFKKIENEILEVAQSVYEVETMNPKKRNTVLSSLVKEKAFHAAVRNKISDIFFEYDRDYNTVQYYNINHRYLNGTLVVGIGENVHPEDAYKIKYMIDSAKRNEYLKRTNVRIKLKEDSEYEVFDLEFETVWNDLTEQCVGAVGTVKKA